jgi:hypothetical protein
MSNTANTEATTPRHYWVVGGQYETLTFDRLIHGTESVLGPFGRREDAESTWRELSDRTRSQATVRFIIASEP